MNSLLALAAKAGTMLTSLVFGVLTARLILGTVGVEYYSLYALLVAFPALLSFTDLGAGAVVVNGVATSDDPRTDPRVLVQLTSVGRILVGFAAVTQCVNTVLLVTGGWNRLLGAAGEIDGAEIAAFLCLSVFACGVPVGIWVRILLGLRKNHLVILLQGLISPLNFVLVWGILQVRDHRFAAELALSSFVASFTVSVIGLTLTARMTRPLVHRALHQIPRPKQAPGTRVMDVGWPMLAQLLAAPIALASQRYVLAQFGSTHEVAEYSVAAQVFFALNGLVMAAGVTLWPTFARQRAQGTIQRGPGWLSAIFAVGVLLATGVVWLVRDELFAFTTNGEVEVSVSTVLSFGAMVTCSAILYPLGMFMMDKPGIRFQVIPALTMAAVSFGLSIPLTLVAGVQGPPLGNVLAVTVCQIIPFSIYVHRHRERLYARSA
ncbi:lipopolysaccharide biosynthesis protein [Aeromicrobium duanguangcaii]|uniref:lipopolysaccharide biosynthesis protein n=1 Tax=Aeromicrobium duanguangcaii TaxID=2968086 RepID=UPI00201761C7|nr:oligosaccharide flippase family protein [Aeromicrobium duanguangcaii]MCL3839190.1 oligosaccharide flippase family protein [Aeromicrobium duanguangcaii]